MTCQGKSYSQCDSDTKTTCMDECTQTTGAIFCDGNFIDSSGSSVAQCGAALNAFITTKLNLTASASGTTTCQGNECTSTGTAKVSCSASPSRGNSGGSLAAFGAMLAVAGVAARRRSKR